MRGYALRLAFPLCLISSGCDLLPSFKAQESAPSQPSAGLAHSEQVFLAVDPVPEFAPVASVLLSEDVVAGFEAGKELLRFVLAQKLQALVLASQTAVQGVAYEALETRPWYRDVVTAGGQSSRVQLLSIPHESVWVRDFGPAFARVTLAADEKGGSAWPKLNLVDFVYRDEGSLSDTVPYLLGLYLRKSVDTLPLLIDGGSYLTNGRECFVSTGELSEAGNFLVKQGGHPQLSLATFKRHLRQSLGCRSVVLFPHSAHDHIDMWAKIVDADTVFVNDLSLPALARVAESLGAVPDELTILKHKLDTAAGVLSQYFRVERIPMPLPEGGLFRTYANALLLNDQALVPRYSGLSPSGEKLADAEYFAEYESRVTAAFKKHGFQVSFIDADKLIAAGGALHCVAVQLPKI